MLMVVKWSQCRRQQQSTRKISLSHVSIVPQSMSSTQRVTRVPSPSHKANLTHHTTLTALRGSASIHSMTRIILPGRAVHFCLCVLFMCLVLSGRGVQKKFGPPTICTITTATRRHFIKKKKIPTETRRSLTLLGWCW